MSQFKRKVVKLAYECFKNKIGYRGRITYDPEINYINLTKNPNKDSFSECFFYQDKSYVRILTFDKIHREEKQFSQLLKKLGISSRIFVKRKDVDLIGRFIPQSPSGLLQNELIIQKCLDSDKNFYNILN